ncbi:helix-turn-helix domain-containing protein [Stackebrandtia nassauensis]|uniref:Transcriptional regulator, AraC family n=1 Tax=Stackebrandtia nassauensis (strain DSM 44728 / CIP 108903 / NRRL B-16338 / NBRC 102104 / LLR-40K-21) TaxID=446470 RepID=D3QC02_STANL|nr:helix-turn-helix domain-containing protein [Stackebrandtia nassauensis]ADD44891.1 transcriptional regulator, AraC family [Stackebrandtia nassauensis DSM 44728]
MDAQPLSASYRTGLPEPRLRPFVDAYIGYREDVEQTLLRREFAGSRTVLILGWGATVTVSDPRGGPAWTGASLIAGPYDSYVVSESHGVSEAVQLMLSPLGARLVYGLPLGELANRTVDPAALDEHWLDALVPRLAEADSWDERFRLLDQTLTARLAVARPLDRELSWAWRRLSETGGRIRVGELAAELELSRGRLARRFKTELGLSPKTAARLLRFDAAYARRDQAGTEGWATVAAACGYFDQAHLNADFRQFTGSTPVTVAARLTMSTDVPPDVNVSLSTDVFDSGR